MYYYIALALILFSGIGYYIVTGLFHSYPTSANPIAVNLTKINNTCKIVWLGGIDFDSFYTNVTINSVNIGHPKPMETIYAGFCKNITIEMYDKAVQSYRMLYTYNTTGGM